MWRALIILILSIGLLGGGFYYFADNEGWFDRDASVNEEESLPSGLAEEQAVAVTPSNSEDLWIDYKYQQNGVLFSSKYPAENWKILEQVNGNEVTVIFTNNDSCQVMYLFDLRQGQYKTELSNNKNSDACANVLRKIVSIATIPQFGVTMTEESETQNNETSSSSAEASTADKTTIASTEKTETVVDSSSSVETETVEPEKDDTPTVPTVLSEGVSDQELLEMTAKERYEGAKAFVNNYLLEYAKRRWATLEVQLSSKAKTQLAGETLATVATPFYYYELLTVLKEIKVGQFQVNVKLTDKEENPIGENGIYTLNIVWEYGEWKTDNYLFQ